MPSRLPRRSPRRGPTGSPSLSIRPRGPRQQPGQPGHPHRRRHNQRRWRGHHPGIEIENLYGWIEETSVYTEISKHDLTRFLAARGHRGINSFEDVYNSGVFHRENDLFHDITGAADVPEENFAYLNGRMKQDALRRHALTLMGRHKVDFLIYPSVQVPSPTHEELDAGKWTALTFPTNTVIGSQTSLPAISVPAGFTETGLPVGLEILGTPLGETKLLQLASQITALLQARRTLQPETAS